MFLLSGKQFESTEPAKITRSGHQTNSKIENTYKNKQFSEQLKMYEHNFYKDAWEELDRPACPAGRLIETA